MLLHPRQSILVKIALNNTAAFVNMIQLYNKQIVHNVKKDIILNKILIKQV